MSNDGFITLETLAARLGLPATWLRSEAEANRIPSVEAGRRRLFSLEAVKAAVQSKKSSGDLFNATQLAIRLKVPSRELRRLAVAGKIPALLIGSTILFNGTAVEKALAELAATERIATTSKLTS